MKKLFVILSLVCLIYLPIQPSAKCDLSAGTITLYNFAQSSFSYEPDPSYGTTLYYGIYDQNKKLCKKGELQYGKEIELPVPKIIEEKKSWLKKLVSSTPKPWVFVAKLSPAYIENELTDKTIESYEKNGNFIGIPIAPGKKYQTGTGYSLSQLTLFEVR